MWQPPNCTRFNIDSETHVRPHCRAEYISGSINIYWYFLSVIRCRSLEAFLMKASDIPDSKVYGANMGLTWGRQDPGGPPFSPMNFVIWNTHYTKLISWLHASNRCKKSGHQQLLFDQLPKQSRGIIKMVNIIASKVSAWQAGRTILGST